MYLFTRRIVISPSHLRAGMASAIEMAEYVNQKTELEVSLFQSVQGEPVGTLIYAYRTESFAASLESVDALVGSDEYLKKVEKAAAYSVGNAEDSLGKILHISGEVSGPPAAAAVVSATLEVPQATAATSWSVELADYTANLTGVPTAVLSSNYGQYGRIAWVSYGQSVLQLEQSQEKTNTDPGFAQRLADSAGLFVPGSGTAALSRRIA